VPAIQIAAVSGLRAARPRRARLRDARIADLTKHRLAGGVRKECEVVATREECRRLADGVCVALADPQEGEIRVEYGNRDPGLREDRRPREPASMPAARRRSILALVSGAHGCLFSPGRG
jgi:hypothetical protein